MKIISPFKDYYDYLQGVYGVDNKLILDRTNYSSIPYTPSIKTKVSIHIGEYLIEGIWVKDKFLYGENIAELEQDKIKPRYYTELRFWNKKDLYYQIPNGKYSHFYILKEPKHLGNKSPTWKENTPILLDEPTGFVHNPILREYNVPSFISPDEVWRWLSEWLSKRITNSEIGGPTGTDKERLEGKGFDNKTSFRGKLF